MIRRVLEAAAALSCSAALLACGADPGNDDELLGEPEEVGQTQSALGIPQSYVPSNRLVRDWNPGSYAYQTDLDSSCQYLTSLRGLHLATGGLATFFTMLCADQVALGDILADGTSRLFFQDTQNSRIYRKDNGTGPTVFLGVPGPFLGTLQADGTYLYWADSEGIRRKRKDGTGSITILYPGPGFMLLGIESGQLYVGNHGTSPRFLYRLSAGGGNLQTIGSFSTGCGASSPCFADFTFDGSYFYWRSTTTSPNRYLIRLAKTHTGTGGTELFHTTQKWLIGPVTDGSNLYWAENASSGSNDLTGTSLRRCTVGVTCTPVTEQANLPSINAMNRNGSYLYWQQAHPTSGRAVMRATAP